ncbi:MAG TPA: hypothetical protein VGG72_08575 [Bryobacteraceae bacterium]|jgi:hypothetical protein
MIEQQPQARGLSFGVLSAGHAKNVVATNQLGLNPGHIAVPAFSRTGI